MPEPLIALPGVEQEDAAAFEQGKSMCMHSMPKGFAFNPYPIGTVLHDNWLQGYSGAWRESAKHKATTTKTL